MLHKNLVLQLVLSSVFFYTTYYTAKFYWPTILVFAGNSGRNLFAYGAMIVHMFLLITLNGLLYFLYKNEFPLVEACRITKNKPWPWNSPDKFIRDQFQNAVFWGILTVLFNNLCVSFPSAFTTFDLGYTYLGAFSYTLESFPTPFTVLWQVFVCAIVEDIMFYHTHRTLHHPSLYGWIHKWHHRFSATIGIASESAHPIEFLLGNLVPVVAGPLLVRAHIFTFLLWLTVRIFETVDAHCGYEFPWSPARLLPFSITTAHHEYHHRHNQGCYGSMFMILDSLYGTDKSFIEFQQKEEAHVTEKTK